MLNNLKVGSKVKTIIPEENGGGYEIGVVLSIDEFKWGTSIVIQVDPKDDDDGFRELTHDQIEMVLE